MTSEQKGYGAQGGSGKPSEFRHGEEPTDAKPKPTDAEIVEVMRDAINQFYGSIEISRSALEAALQALRDKGMI